MPLAESDLRGISSSVHSEFSVANGLQILGSGRNGHRGKEDTENSLRAGKQSPDY